jgi:hypothetical protein
MCSVGSACCADWDHRRAAGVDRVDDLGIVDALEVDRRDPEVAVTELALDEDQRNTLMRYLDRVRVLQLVWREATADTGDGCGAADFAACLAARMSVTISSTVGGSAG